MTTKNLVILGAGALGREIIGCIEENARGGLETGYEVIGFIDQDTSKLGQLIQGLPIYSFEQIKGNNLLQSATYICGIGNPVRRKSMLEELERHLPNAPFATVIHRSAVLMPGVEVEEGVYIGVHSSIGIATLIRRHAVINFNCSIGHDCEVGDYSVISPGCVLSGYTILGPAVFLGSAAVTYPGVKIGERAVVGAQGCVARSLKAGHKLIPKPNAMILPPDANG